jgi:hypothetical protein
MAFDNWATRVGDEGAAVLARYRAGKP